MFTTQNIIWDNSTDANFRGWVSLIHNQILAMGLTVAPDTGQLDPTTVTRPLAGFTIQGYRMYRFADALQGAAPVTVKLRFGSAGSAASPTVHIQVGKATDGAGTFVGAEKSSVLTLDGISGGAGTLHLCILSGDVSRVCVVMGNDADIGIWFVVERSRDNAGAESTEGILLMAGTRGANNAEQQFVPMVGPPPPLEPMIQAICSGNASSAFGLLLGVGVPIPLAGSPKNYGVAAIIYCSGDFATNLQIAVMLYGVARNYYTVGGFFSSLNGVSTSRLAILYQ